MKGSPAFQWYPAEYLADLNVELMTLEEEGAYIRAMSYYWREGSLPADPELLSRLLKNADQRVVRTVVQRFVQNGSVLVHVRLEKEREKQANWRAKSAEGGKCSGKARRQKKLHTEPNAKGGSTKREPNHEPNANSLFLSLSSNKEINKEKSELPEYLDVSLWLSWVEMRKKIHNAPFTERARKGILDDLAKLKSYGKDPNERLEAAIKRGWRGVLFDSDKPNGVVQEKPTWIDPETGKQIGRGN